MLNGHVLRVAISNDLKPHLHITKRVSKANQRLGLIKKRFSGLTPTKLKTPYVSLVRPVLHDDVIKWKHFPRYWPFVRGIHRPPVNSPHKDQWRGALMFTLICARINGWVNNREAGDLRGHRAHSDVIVMSVRVPSMEPVTCVWQN